MVSRCDDTTSVDRIHESSAERGLPKTNYSVDASVFANNAVSDLDCLDGFGAAISEENLRTREKAGVATTIAISTLAIAGAITVMLNPNRFAVVGAGTITVVLEPSSSVAICAVHALRGGAVVALPWPTEHPPTKQGKNGSPFVVLFAITVTVIAIAFACLFIPSLSTNVG